MFNRVSLRSQKLWQINIRSQRRFILGGLRFLVDIDTKFAGHWIDGNWTFRYTSNLVTPLRQREKSNLVYAVKCTEAICCVSVKTTKEGCIPSNCTIIISFLFLLTQNTLVIDTPRVRKQTRHYSSVKEDEMMEFSELESEEDEPSRPLSKPRRPQDKVQGYPRSECFRVEKNLLVYGFVQRSQQMCTCQGLLHDNWKWTLRLECGINHP